MKYRKLKRIRRDGRNSTYLHGEW